MSRKTSKTTRREVVEKIAASSLLTGTISGVATADSGRDTNNQSQLDTGFDPSDPDKVDSFAHAFYDLNEEERTEIRSQLSDEQSRALTQIQIPVTIVEQTVKSSSDSSVSSMESGVETDKTVTNSSVGDEWGWERGEVSVSNPVTTRELTQTACDAACECVTSCENSSYTYSRNPNISPILCGHTTSAELAGYCGTSKPCLGARQNALEG